MSKISKIMIGSVSTIAVAGVTIGGVTYGITSKKEQQNLDSMNSKQVRDEVQKHVYGGSSETHFADTISNIIQNQKRRKPRLTDKAGKPMIYPGKTRINQSRDTDTLVVFDHDYPDATTHTNAWGASAVFTQIEKNGKLVPDLYSCTKTGGMNNIIPEHGFVLSGHGKAATYVTDTFSEGDVISISIQALKDDMYKKGDPEVSADPHMIGVTKTLKFSQSWDLKFFQNKSSNLVGILKELHQESIDKFEVFDEKTYQTFLKSLESSAKQIATFDSSYPYYKQVEAYNKATDTFEKGASTVIAKHIISTTAVWHRPSDKSVAEVDATLDRMGEMGINTVYLELYGDDGKVIFDPTAFNNYVNTNPEVYNAIGKKPTFIGQTQSVKTNSYGKYGKDLLAAYIGEAAKKGIEVSAWMRESFVGADEINLENKGTIIGSRPDWISKDLKGNVAIGKEESSFRFVDMGNPEARRWLLEQHRWLLNHYHGLAAIQEDDHLPFPAIENGHAEDPSFMNGINPGAIWDYIFDDKLGLDGKPTPDYIGADKDPKTGVITYKLRELILHYINGDITGGDSWGWKNHKDLWQQVTKVKADPGIIDSTILKTLTKDQLLQIVKDAIMDTKDEATRDRNANTLMRLFKTRVVTSFMYTSSRDIHRSGRMVSNAVFTAIKTALNEKTHDWLTWVENGWVDTTLPMVYFADPEIVNNTIGAVVSYFGSKTQLIAGVSPTDSGGNFLWSKQIRGLMPKVRENGFGSFAFAWLDSYEQELYKLSAALPNGVLPVRSTDDMNVMAKGVKKFLEDVFEKQYALEEIKGISTDEKNEISSNLEKPFKDILDEIISKGIVNGKLSQGAYVKPVYDKLLSLRNSTLKNQGLRIYTKGDYLADQAKKIKGPYTLSDIGAIVPVKTGDWVEGELPKKLTTEQQYVATYLGRYVDPILSTWGIRISTGKLVDEQVKDTSPEYLTPEYMTKYSGAVYGSGDADGFLVDKTNDGHKDPETGAEQFHRDGSSLDWFTKAK